MTADTQASGERMPALYIGHGAPPLLDDPVWSSQLVGLAADLPRPTAILIVNKSTIGNHQPAVRQSPLCTRQSAVNREQRHVPGRTMTPASIVSPVRLMA